MTNDRYKKVSEKIKQLWEQGYYKNRIIGKNSGQFKKGIAPWNKRLKGYLKGRKITWGDKISKALKGRKQSQELIEKRRQAIWGKERYEMQVKAILKGLMKRPTSLEKQMMSIIKKYNLPYKYTGDGSFLVGHKNPDFVNINGEKKLIEVANLQHHDQNYSRERSNYFKKWGWKSYIFRTDKLDEEEILEKIEEVFSKEKEEK